MTIVNHDRTLYEICKRLKLLQDAGMSIEDIEAAIRKMELPLRQHMFIMGNFSGLMELKY
jgi:DNA-binding transcriptional MerR regulator